MEFHTPKLIIEDSCNSIQPLFALLWIKVYVIILIQVISILYEGSQVTRTQKIDKQTEYVLEHSNA